MRISSWVFGALLAGLWKAVCASCCALKNPWLKAVMFLKTGSDVLDNAALARAIWDACRAARAAVKVPLSCDGDAEALSLLLARKASAEGILTSAYISCVTLVFPSRRT